MAVWLLRQYFSSLISLSSTLDDPLSLHLGPRIHHIGNQLGNWHYIRHHGQFAIPWHPMHNGSRIDLLAPSFPIHPTFSFDSISGGHNFICSLRSGDASFFCWEVVNLQVKRIYSGPKVPTELFVGARHMVTLEGDPLKMQTIWWWRYGCHNRSRPCPNFPKSIDGVFHSITSGYIFTCAIGVANEVHCWELHAKSIMMRFTGLYMRSVTAGRSHMCGLKSKKY